MKEGEIQKNLSADGGYPENEGYSIKSVLVPSLLFALTVLTTLWVGGTQWNVEPALFMKNPNLADIFIAGIPYALPLLGILLFHEMGHFIAGKIHRLNLTLPYFIPIPTALGTMGAIIVYKSKIRSRRKLLDVSAAGPLSGIIVATIFMVIGLKLSTVEKIRPGMGVIIHEGQSLYYMFLKWCVFGKIPSGYDVFLHPVAWASWVGLFVTMINLLPVGQLDGGHIAYSLLGNKQNKTSKIFHVSMIFLAVAIGLFYAFVAFQQRKGLAEVASEAFSGSFWLVWAAVLLILKKIGRGYHPPVEEDESLGKARVIIAGLLLLLFVLLFMPVPIKVIDV